MSRRLTVVVYHYVRDLANSRYPRIKGIPTALFERQLEYLQRNCTIIGVEEMISAIEDGSHLPANAALLSFDDGYLDHFQTVFPLLMKCGLPAVFFPATQACLERKALDVNKIHFLLARAPDSQILVQAISRLLDKARAYQQLPTNDEYFVRLAVPSRFDNKETVFIKRLLQRELPQPLRSEIVNALFAEYVGLDEAIFCNELYMTMEQLLCLRRCGMTIGGHGRTHQWLTHLTAEERKAEIASSAGLLRSLGIGPKEWFFSYPYGDHDKETMELLGQSGFRAAVTTKVGIADLDTDECFGLPRLDTNDLPKS